MLDELVALTTATYPQPALDAGRSVLIHDLAVGLSARELVRDLVEDALTDGPCTDLLTGRSVDALSAISRNAQVIHALTQDETHLAVMTHVGATSIPLLLALAESADLPVDRLTLGLTAAIAGAEALGWGVSPQLPSRGVRPTSVIGPSAAIVGVAAMLQWPEDRTRRALGKVASVAFGTQQAWVEGSQEWLFQVAAAGVNGYLAVRSSVGAWAAASDPYWGTSGLFPALGVTGPADTPVVDHRLAATRVSLKRFPVCATNQVPLSLLQRVIEANPGRAVRAVDTLLAHSLATYPGTDRTTALDSWTVRLMSLPYCVAVMAANADFVVEDLRRQPATVPDASVPVMRVIADDRPVGDFVLDVTFADGSTSLVRGVSADFGRPERAELDQAATAVLGAARVQKAWSLTGSGAPAVDLPALLLA